MHNIKKALRYANKQGLTARSKNWYTEANLFAQELSTKYRISLDKICGIIAGLSPAISWEQNKKDAEILALLYDLNLHNEALEHHRFSTYARNVLKCIDILNRDAEVIQAFSNKKCGFKTRYFYLNILKPTEQTGVTIDRHAVAIAEGRNYSEAKGLTPKQYNDYACQYIKIARENDLLAHELQAITWVAYKHAKDNNIEIY